MFHLNLPILAGTVAATTSTTDTSLSATNAVEGVTSIAEAISNYGFTVVFGAVIILLFIVLFLMFFKLTNKMINAFTSKMEDEKNQNAAIMNKIMEKFFEEPKKDDESFKKKEKEDEDDKEHHDLIGTFMDRKAIFKKEAQTVINTLRCDRIAIYVFHNGNKAFYGFPFIKMSCIFEDTLKGMMTPRSRTHINLPLHLFNDMIDNLYHDIEFAGNLDDIEIHDSSVKEFLESSDSKALFIRAIKNGNGALAGFTVCEFEEPVDFANPEVYNKIKFALKDMNAAIRYFITNDTDANEDKKEKKKD